MGGLATLCATVSTTVQKEGTGPAALLLQAARQVPSKTVYYVHSGCRAATISHGHDNRHCMAGPLLACLSAAGLGCRPLPEADQRLLLLLLLISAPIVAFMICTWRVDDTTQHLNQQRPGLLG